MDCRVCCSPASAERSGPQDSPDPVDLSDSTLIGLALASLVYMYMCVGKLTADEDSTHNAYLR